MIEKKGGKLLSDKYINNETNLDIECKRGHKFSMTPNSIQQNNWCAECWKYEKRMEEFNKYIVDKLNELNIEIPFKDVNIDTDMMISDIRRLR